MSLNWILIENQRCTERLVPSPILSSAAFSSSSPDMLEVRDLSSLQYAETSRSRSKLSLHQWYYKTAREATLINQNAIPNNNYQPNCKASEVQ